MNAGVTSANSIGRPARVITDGAAPVFACRSRIVAKRASETRSAASNLLRSFAGSPASTISAVIVPSGRAAMSAESSRDGYARNTASPRRTARPSVPGTTRAAASAIVRPRSGTSAPASSTSSESRPVTLSPIVARTARIVSSPSALVTARPTARRSMSGSPRESSPTPTTRPSSRSRTQTPAVSRSSTCADCASSAGSASASSHARAAMNASSAVSSSGAVFAAAAVGLGADATPAAGGVAALQQSVALQCISPHRTKLCRSKPRRKRRETPVGMGVAIVPAKYAV